jgi:hypothetical protein
MKNYFHRNLHSLPWPGSRHLALLRVQRHPTE